MLLRKVFFTSADGTSIQCFSHGHGVPVILLHGLQGSAAVWLNLLPRLPSQFRYIIPNLRGRGGSGQPQHRMAYHLARFVDDLETIVAAEHEPVIIVGWSMGASVAWAYAHRSASRNQVRGWFFVSGTPDPLNTHRLFCEEDDLEDALNQRVRHLPVGDVCPPAIAVWAWYGFRDADFIRNPPVLHAPSLMMHGSEDKDCPIESARKLAQILKSDWVEMEGVGHSPMRENPDRFVKELDKFLRTIVQRE